MKTKKCTKCGEVKPVECFSKQSNLKDGMSNHCKSCVSVYQKAWFLKNKKIVLESQRKKHIANRHARNNISKQWRANNKAECIKKRRMKCKQLEPSYVAQLLQIKTEELTPEILRLKRDQVEIRRLSRQIKTTLKEANEAV